MVTQAEIIAVYAPAYVDDPRMPAAISIAEKQVNPEHCFYEEVVVLLAAHMLEIGDRAGAGGTVASKSEGGLSISYNAGSSSGLLGTTSYGMQIESLNRLCYGLTARTGWLDQLPLSGI